MDQLAKACPVPILGGFGGSSENASEAAMSEEDDEEDEEEDEAMEEGEAVAPTAMEVSSEESGLRNRKTSRVRTTISDEQVRKKTRTSKKGFLNDGTCTCCA